MMRVLELFAGIGGMSLGLERAGFDVVGQVEIDPWARGVLAKHWPEVPRHDDVRTALDWWRSEPRPVVDMVAGGYPCQGESLAGRRRGTGDERWLWPEYARIVSALRPRYVLGENVIGHRTNGLRFVLRDLELLGYTARAGVLSAREVGAHHQRKRIFVIAERNDLADAAGDRREARTGRGRGGAERSEGAQERNEPAGRGEAVAYARGQGLEGSGRVHRADAAGRTGPVAADDRGEGRGGVRIGYWPAEPDVGRVAHGVPGRVDRLRGLGNAVVPACAEHIGNLIRSGEWRDL